MPRLLHKKYNDIPAKAVYIGRGSKWGNPFKIGEDGTRLEVVVKFMKHLAESQNLLDDLPELEGKDLVCFCSPRLCHGEILMLLANAKS